jgi:hypothetical protein
MSEPSPYGRPIARKARPKAKKARAKKKAAHRVRR